MSNISQWADLQVVKMVAISVRTSQYYIKFKWEKSNKKDIKKSIRITMILPDREESIRTRTTKVEVHVALVICPRVSQVESAMELNIRV